PGGGPGLADPGAVVEADGAVGVLHRSQAGQLEREAEDAVASGSPAGEGDDLPDVVWPGGVVDVGAAEQARVVSLVPADCDVDAGQHALDVEAHRPGIGVAPDQGCAAQEATESGDAGEAGGDRGGAVPEAT